MFLLGLTGCCPYSLVPTDERATGKPKLSNLSSAAGEWYPEGRSQLCHQPDGEQVSVTFNRKTLQLILHMSYLFSMVQGVGDVIHQILCHLKKSRKAIRPSIILIE